LRGVQEAARVIGLQTNVLNASTSGEIEAVFATLARERPDALFVAPDAFFLSRRVQIANLAARGRIASAYSLRDHVVAGGVMSYGTDIADRYRQIGVYSGSILKGVKPADLPLRVAAALNERRGVHPFFRPPVALVRRLVVDAALAGHQVLPHVPSVRGEPPSTLAALDQAAEEVLHGGLAVALPALAQPLLRLVEHLLADNRRNLHPDPFRSVAVYEGAALGRAPAVRRVLHGCHAVVVPDAGVRVIVQHALDLRRPPELVALARRYPALFEQAGDVIRPGRARCVLISP
jgi:hypothetical protein